MSQALDIRKAISIGMSSAFSVILPPEVMNDILYTNLNPTQMYCVKCRAKQVPSYPEIVIMRNGKKAVKGLCPVCTTGMYSLNAEGFETYWDLAVKGTVQVNLQPLVNVLHSKL